MEHKVNCFEVYGFDIVLDEDLNAWVIEVNLSPACSERTPWLTKMLDDMGLGLLGYLEQKILLQSEEWEEPLKVKKDEAARRAKASVDSNYLNDEDFYI